MPDQILAQVRNSIKAKKRKPLLDDYIGESFYEHLALSDNARVRLRNELFSIKGRSHIDNCIIQSLNESKSDMYSPEPWDDSSKLHKNDKKQNDNQNQIKKPNESKTSAKCTSFSGNSQQSETTQSIEVEPSLAVYIDSLFLVHKETLQRNFDQHFAQQKSEIENLANNETSQFKKNVSHQIQTVNSWISSFKLSVSLLDERLEGVKASLKDKESLLNERLEGVEASLKDKGIAVGRKT